MSLNRPITDFPRNEAGLVDTFLGTAYDVVKGVYDNLDDLQELHDVLPQIPTMAQDAVDTALVEAMPPVRLELDAAILQAQTWAEGTQPDPEDPLAKSAKEWADQTFIETLRFLTPKAIVPLVRDDGSALQDGDQYQNTTDGLSYTRVASGWTPMNEGVQQLLLDLADPTDPANGAGMSAWKRSAISASVSNVQQLLSTLTHNVWEKAELITDKPTSDPKTWDWSPAIVAAWNATPEGQTLVIPLGVHIASPVTLIDKAVNIHCMGPITVADGAWTALYFDNTANVVEYPGTILSDITGGNMTLHFLPGQAPTIKPSDYYLVIYSLEANVNRVNEDHYTPYTKRETHGLSHYDWSVVDPILYTYTDLSAVTLRFIKKSPRTQISGLHLKAASTVDRSARALLRTRCKSCVDFNGLFIDGAAANRLGFGFEIYECFDFVLNSPRITGYNCSGGDSYKIRNFMSAHLVFNDYVDAIDADPVAPNNKTERGYAAMYGNMVTFNNCHLTGIDEHYGSRYVVNGGSLTHRGIVFSGRDFTIIGTKFLGPGIMFQPRDDAPSCHGTLLIKDVEIDPLSQLILGETNANTDPLGRTTPFKRFDRVLVEGVIVKGGLLQPMDNIISLRGIRSATFTSSKTTLIELKNLRIYNERANVNQCVLQIANLWVDNILVSNWDVVDSVVAYRGDIRYLGPIYTDLSVGELRVSNSKITVYGVRNTDKFTMVGGTLGGSGERLSVAGDQGTVAVTLNNVSLEKPLSESAPVAGVNPSWDITDCTVNVAPDNLSGLLARGLRNSLALGVVIPSNLVGKLRVYENSALYSPTTIAATASWSVPDILAGSFATSTFTVTGAVFGDQVDASIFPFNLVTSAQVISNDTVRVTLFNGTASTVSPGIQAIRFTVRKL